MTSTVFVCSGRAVDILRWLATHVIEVRTPAQYMLSSEL